MSNGTIHTEFLHLSIFVELDFNDDMVLYCGLTSFCNFFQFARHLNHLIPTAVVLHFLDNIQRILSPKQLA